VKLNRIPAWVEAIVGSVDPSSITMEGRSLGLLDRLSDGPLFSISGNAGKLKLTLELRVENMSVPSLTEMSVTKTATGS